VSELTRQICVRWAGIERDHRQDISGDPALLVLGCTCGVELGQLAPTDEDRLDAPYIPTWVELRMLHHRVELLLEAAP
jgi:hypothetical protein